MILLTFLNAKLADFQTCFIFCIDIIGHPDDTRKGLEEVKKHVVELLEKKYTKRTFYDVPVQYECYIIKNVPYRFILGRRLMPYRFISSIHIHSILLWTKKKKKKRINRKYTLSLR